MSRKQILIYVLVAAALGALIYSQVQHWRKFDWEKFGEQLSHIHWWMVAAAVVLVYLADSLRALRWAIFLRPVRKVRPTRLWAAQFIGFTGLALLGRPGEFVRPYIIARKEGLSLSSQMAVWLVERIFDTGAVAIILSFALLTSKSLHGLESFGDIRKGGLFLLAFVAIGIGAALLIRLKSTQLAAWLSRRLQKPFPNYSEKLGNKVRAFGKGLNTIHSIRAFLALSVISLSIWMLVAVAYQLVIHAYHSHQLRALTFADAVLLMTASIAGGVLQLPVVGGGSQLATIAVLLKVFGIGAATAYLPERPELATSCGILLWLVTFISVVPLGLALAHHEHVSLRELTQQSHEPDAAIN
jgi:uncharacterized protein (TIRG00374 family)